MPVNTVAWNKIRYTLWAPGYDFVARILLAQRRRSIETLAPGPQDSILILGAGTGLDLQFLRNCSNITAVDITPAMLRRLQKRASGFGMNVTAKVMDGQKLEFENESFDSVILHLILAVIPDPVACIRETQRVLKRGGRAVILDKFLKPNTRPSIPRKMLNVLTNLAFSDINRDLEDILAHTNLRKISDLPAGFGGHYRIVLVEKPA